MLGDSGNDRLRGSEGADRLTAAPDDRPVGGAGNDRLYGAWQRHARHRGR